MHFRTHSVSSEIFNSTFEFVLTLQGAQDHIIRASLATEITLLKVSEDKLIFLVNNGFTIPKISEMLGNSKRTVARRMFMFGIGISGQSLILGFVTASLG